MKRNITLLLVLLGLCLNISKVVAQNKPEAIHQNRINKLPDYHIPSTPFVGETMQKSTSFAANWKIIFVFCWLMGAALTKKYYYQYIISLLAPFISINKANIYYRQKSSGFHTGSFLLLLNYLLANTFLAYVLLRYKAYFVSINDEELIVLILIVFISLDLLHNLMVQYVHYLFRPGDLLPLYNFHIGLIQQLSGLILSLFMIFALLLPVSIGHQIASIGLILSIILLFTGLFRSLFVLQRQSKLSALHLILYICTLEIAPLAVALKGFFWISARVT